MAGHSKWANIKHRKERQDAKRGKIFTKLIRELTVAAKQAGGNPSDNPRLRLAVDKALAANMTRDTMDRAIARGAGSNEAESMEELSYEGYAAGGVAIMVEALTENRNRTAADVRHAFSKCGGNLGTDGSVAYLFERKGLLVYGPSALGTPISEDALMEAALEAGADDVIAHHDGSFEVFTAFTDFMGVNESMRAKGFVPDNAELTMVAGVLASLDEEGAEKVFKLIDMLEDLDDVQNVYSNAEFPD